LRRLRFASHYFVAAHISALDQGEGIEYWASLSAESVFQWTDSEGHSVDDLGQ
jgi:hypothetical protein